MDLLEILILGLAQGLTEFLPVSSTAHLRLIPELFGWEDPGAAFTAITQLGTMAAVTGYFRHDLVRIGASWGRSLRRPELRGELDTRLGWYLIISTIPLVFFGAIFVEEVETAARNLTVIAIMLIALALALLWSEVVGARSRGIESLTLRDAITIGLAQALALIPGTSRTGATITAGLFIGLTRPAAARYSFLLSVPAVILSGAFELLRVLRGTTAIETDLAATVAATFVAFVAAYLTIDWMLRFLERHSTGIFIVYRIALGAFILTLLGAGTID